MKIYVGNLNFTTGPDAIQALFSQYGSVEEVHLPTDRQSGRPRGFAFVTMPDAAEGQAAIEGLNGTELDGRRLNVDEARPTSSGGRSYRDRRGGRRPRT